MIYPTKYQEGRSALSLALERGDVDVMKALIEGGADVNTQDKVIIGVGSGGGQEGRLPPQKFFSGGIAPTKFCTRQEVRRARSTVCRLRRRGFRGVHVGDMRGLYISFYQEEKMTHMRVAGHKCSVLL